MTGSSEQIAAAGREALWEKFTAGEKLAYGCGYRDALAHIDTLTAAVKALPFVPDEDTEGWEWVSRSDILAILDDRSGTDR